MIQTQTAESAPEGASLSLLVQKSLRHAFDRTPLTYPKTISLQKRKCPRCKEPLAAPDLANGTVRTECRTEGCGFSLDLFWLPA